MLYTMLLFFFRDHFMKEFISFETYANDAIKLADMIKKTGRTFKSIIVITRGGLFPATILSAQLNIKKIDTFCLASYAKNYYNGNIYMAPTIKIFNCAKYLTENILY